MSIDEREQPKEEAATPASTSEPEEDTQSRLDAAKAFFRSLHAGETAGSAEETGESAGTCPGCQHLEGKLAELEQKVAQSESLYKRMAADFENYRRRIDREREDFQSSGMQRAVEALLPALDDIDRAQSNLSLDLPSEKLMESLNLVFNRIKTCLEQMGVKPLSAVGEHFDPKYHEPVQEIETSEFPDGTVMQELRRGYSFNDRILRPALVNVAAARQAPATEEPAAGKGKKGKKGSEELAAAQEPEVYDLSEFADADVESPDNDQSPGELPEV